jgi:hypothetical protein
MLPWGHAAVGYLLYTEWGRWQRDDSPHGIAVLALALGTQFPDLVDKPLSWTFALLPTGRSLGHSLLVFALLTGALVALARQYDQQPPVSDSLVTTSARHPSSRRASLTVTAFVIGYGSHLLADVAAGIVTGDFNVRYLLYPLVQLGGSEHGYSFLEFFLSLTLTPLLVFEVVLTIVAFGVWLRDGHPGLAILATTVGRLESWIRSDHDT